MKKQSPLGLSLLFVCLLLCAPFAPFCKAQQTTPVPSAPPQSSSGATQPAQASDDDEVVRITSNLVQIDAVVTDRNGVQVTDLRPEEIEIFEDGRPQKITNFSYVSNETGMRAEPLVASTATSKPNEKLAPPVPPARPRPEQVRRTVALVVDDLGASFESTHSIRQALRKYVEQQMQPTDLVAIIRTSAGMGALQQFTSDRRQLNAAIERVRWNPVSGRISAFAPIESDPFAQAQREAGLGDSGRTPSEARAELDEFREQIFSVGTLGALNFVIRGMRELPGRKAVVLFSDGIELLDSNGERNDRILEALRRLTDLANRASVVIYTIDARGLQYAGLTAADSTSGMRIRDIETLVQERSRKLFESQSGLQYLAQQTGGFAIRNSNDLSRGVGRVLDDQKGYYLIGYRPDESTFDIKGGRSRFHKITGRVKRSGGLRLRLRSGFYSFTEEETRPAARTRQEQILAALSSPFASGGVGLRLTTLFANNDRDGSFVRSLLHINARDFAFKPEADGWQKAVIEVVAFTFGDNGRVVNQISRSETIRARGETYTDVLKNGLVYNFDVPIKKPGAYQLRIAVRDTDSERIGSASQFIEVPDVNKKRLTLSGIVLTGIKGDSAADSKATQPGADARSSASAAASVDARLGEGSEVDPQMHPAVRQFRRGAVLDYFYYIYNAKLDRAGGRPQLQTQVRLFREGQPVYTGTPTPLDLTRQPDARQLVGGSRIHLGGHLQPGEYLLQVIVADLLAGEKRRTATQWIDFEIVK
ncbi:MAG TPA: VWA domain-containing protein [Pyrinomonadaceae bacterium]|jgi:VWFA-related protein